MPIAPPPPPPPFPNSALLLKRSIGTNTVLYRYPEEDLIHAHQQSSEEEAGEGEGVVSTDYIIIKNLTVHTVTGLDEWGRDRRLQPILISLSVHTDLSGVGAHDVLTDSLSYGTLSKKVKSFTESTACITVEGLALSIAKYCFGEFAMIQEITVKVEKPKGHLYAEGAGAQITRTRKDMEIEEALFKEYEGKINLESGLLPLSWKERMDANVDMDFIFLKNLTIHTIIGCNPWERVSFQLLNSSLGFNGSNIINFIGRKTKSHCQFDHLPSYSFPIPRQPRLQTPQLPHNCTHSHKIR